MPPAFAEFDVEEVADFGFVRPSLPPWFVVLDVKEAADVDGLGIDRWELSFAARHHSISLAYTMFVPHDFARFSVTSFSPLDSK